MGLDLLLAIWVVTWVFKTAATDIAHAVKGTPNPRYELKRERALKAGQPVKGQPRYGTKEYASDFLSDFLKAKTEKRRELVKAKAQPLDDLAEAVREPRPQPAPSQRVSRPETDEDWCERHQMPRMRQGVTERGPRSQFCPCGPRITYEPPEPPEDFDPALPPHPDVRPDAQIIQFPNVKHIEKEITMANSEAAGLTTAIAFAEAAASAHQSFATAGAEGYIGALQRGDMDGEPVDTAREAMEASGIAADKWNAHKAKLEAQLNIKEAYQAQPGAANKEYLLNG